MLKGLQGKQARGSLGELITKTSKEDTFIGHSALILPDGDTAHHGNSFTYQLKVCGYLMDVSLSELRELVMDRGAWRAAIHGVAKSRTRLSNWTELNWTELKYPPGSNGRMWFSYPMLGTCLPITWTSSVFCFAFPSLLYFRPPPHTRTHVQFLMWKKLLCDLHFPRECLQWHFRFLMRMPSVFFLVIMMDPRKSADLMIYVSHTVANRQWHETPVNTSFRK